MRRDETSDVGWERHGNNHSTMKERGERILLPPRNRTEIKSRFLTHKEQSNSIQLRSSAQGWKKTCS